MNKVLDWVGGLLLGSIIGAGLVLLFLPRSGAETRRRIQGRVDAILEEGQQAAEIRRKELIGRFETLKQPKST